MATKPLPSRERILQLMDYDPQTGMFTYKHCKTKGKIWNLRCPGKPAMNYDNGTGYKSGIIDGQKFYAHRVAWLIMTGEEPEVIDHINGSRSDNRFCNLRSVSALENARNTKRTITNKSGVMGVHWYKAYSKWSVYIGYNPIRHLGYFSCWGKAVKTRKLAEKHHAYHPNHGRSGGMCINIGSNQ